MVDATSVLSIARISAARRPLLPACRSTDAACDGDDGENGKKKTLAHNTNPSKCTHAVTDIFRTSGCPALLSSNHFYFSVCRHALHAVSLVCARDCVRACVRIARSMVLIRLFIVLSRSAEKIFPDTKGIISARPLCPFGIALYRNI